MDTATYVEQAEQFIEFWKTQREPLSGAEAQAILVFARWLDLQAELEQSCTDDAPPDADGLPPERRWHQYEDYADDDKPDADGEEG